MELPERNRQSTAREPSKLGVATFLDGGGEMGARMRAKNWAATPLGPVETWSPALRTTTSLLLANRFPMLLWWGPTSISIYNDAYIPVLGVKHPHALGLPVSECWSEIHDVLRPLIRTPLLGGPATWSDDLRLEIRRHGFLEETHWTVAYSPVPDETAPNGIGGVLATVHEITAQVVAARRATVLRELGARVNGLKSEELVCRAAAGVLAQHAEEVPFARLYLADSAGDAKEPRLAASTGGAVDASPGGWPVAEVIRARSARLIERGADSEREVRALVLPIGASSAPGALVAGVSPRLELDAQYRIFFDLVAAQLTSAMSSARAYEVERRRAEALVDLDRAKTAFFSNVSHEPRTPLSLILGHVAEGLDEVAEPLTPGQRERSTTVQRNALRLLKLVNSLLDFSRIEAGRIDVSYEATDLAALTADVASTFRSLVERGGLRLTVDCAPLAAPVYVDRAMWETIVLNLLSNAFKFTLEGEIAVRLEGDTRAVRLEVADTGAGIDAEHLPRVFERFYRVEGAEGRAHEGTGIGLALVQELARLHGGTVTAASEKGRGSRFVVTLPTGSAHLRPDRLRPSPARGSTTARAFVEEATCWAPSVPARRAPDARAALEPVRIVVADDNADMRAYLARLLGPLGEVELVRDGREALEAVARRPPDLVLSDVMMPRLDGIGLARALRDDPVTASIPIVLVSARASERSRVDAASTLADDYVVKPFSARELVARVRAQLVLARLRRQHAEALLASEGKFRALVTASADVVYLVNRDWSEMRPLVEDGRDGPRPTTTWLELHAHPDDRARVRAHIDDAIRDKRVFELEHRVLRDDGSVGWTHSKAVPLVDARGEIVEWLGAAYDVTERRATQERLREANEMLAEEDRRKNELLAMLSHELRNPLTPIVTGLSILRKVPAGDARAERARDVIERQVGQLASLVNDLLDVTRVTRNLVRLQRERLDLTEVARSAVEDNRAFFERAGVRVALETRDRAVPIVADRTRMVQIAGNLLHNAAKFTRRGGHARVIVQVDGADTVLRVIDDGVGMTRTSLEHMFEPFVQAEQTLDRSQGGLGLGLTLVKRLVELHGGTASARSEGLGHGAEVVVRLPLAAREQEEETRAPPSRPPARRRVLIIEDNVDAAEVLRDTLDFSGHEVAIAHDGPAGLARARAFRPEIVLCDIGLPGMNGYEVARAFRADDALKETYLVALSGYARPEDLERAAEAGFARHLAKPPSIEKLDQLLAAAPARE